MGEKEKGDVHQTIIEGIREAMVIVYWMVGGTCITMLTIFVAIAWPLTNQIIDLNKDVSNLKQQVDNAVSSNEAYKNFLPKGLYHQLEKDSYESIVQSIRHPEDADYLMIKNGIDQAERLEIRYRGSIQTNSKN